MLIVCTDVPQQRTNSANVSSLAASWERKRQAIIEACYRNKVHCCDTMGLVNFDMSLEPFYVGPTDLTTNSGVKYMDGLHLNEFGDKEKAEIVCRDAGLV